MGLIRGIDAILKLDDGTDQLVGCARAITFDITRELIETSGAGTGVFRTYKPAAIGFTGSIEGLALIATSGTTWGVNNLYEFLINGTPLIVTFYEVDNAAPQSFLQKQGTVYLTAISEIASFDNIVTFNASFTGTGTITITADEV